MLAPPSLPGTVAIGGPEPTLEWVRPGGGVLGALSLRLGSDPRAEELLVVVLRSLRDCLPADTWDGIADEMPYSARMVLRDPMQAAGPPAVDPVETVARAMLHPRARATLDVRAVFGALKETLPRGLSDAVAGELPTGLRAVWSSAR